MKNTLTGLAAAVMTLAAGAAQAVEVTPLIGFGLTFGGDNIATARYTNGDTAEINGGGLIAFHGGLEFKFDDKVSGQFVAGYHFDRANADNGSMRFDRIPLEFLGHYRLADNFRLGGGVRYINRAKVRASGVGSTLASDEDFKPSTGFVIEGEYLFANSALGLKVRAVSEEFESKTFPNASNLDGSHIGFFLNYYFK